MPRSIADQTVEELGGRSSVLARQRADHVELDRLLHELKGTTGTEQERVLRPPDGDVPSLTARVWLLRKGAPDFPSRRPELIT